MAAAHAQTPPPALREHKAESTASPAAAAPEKLPADVTSHHTLALPNRTLHFAATAASIKLRGDNGDVEAQLASIAYQLDGADKLTRPVTFVFNGGPGMASGWLQVGAVGPWRVVLHDDPGQPATPPAPMPNADTWLDFTDLVFIDPAGTGFSTPPQGDAAQRRLWSVTGDAAALAEAIRQWLDRNDRATSPHFLLGESYGGLRVPRIARDLQSEQGVAVAGMVLLSPALDIHTQSGFTDPLGWVDRLPSEVAAARALKGPVTRADVADAEQYAATDYVTDLLRGDRDAAALDRLSTRVAALTGLDPALVRRYHGRLDTDVFLHELQRAQGLVGSVYDATIADPDPFPHRQLSRYPDPVLQGFKAPVTSAMVAIYHDKLHWRPEASYRLANDVAAERWDWGHGIGRPESVSFLQAALSLNPRMHVLIGHGLFDLMTPYFTTELIMRALPDTVAGRVRLAVYPGGHMFYSQDASRAALHQDALALFAKQ
ncbi:MAG TPA: alpha/beta hydrolase [Acetobacteraceae bacterium]|nr:alpha/beta hydrolase [Acetobacteraceae bacterium]